MSVPTPRTAGPELRATIVARDRIALELRRCDVEIARAMGLRDSSVWRYWANRREAAWTQLAELDAQKALLTH
jgi:hypothetical protein